MLPTCDGEHRSKSVAQQVHASVDASKHLFINMAVVWDDETVFKLIELFEKKRILWDCSTKDYKNKIKKNDAWEEISNALAIPKTDVENKIRSQFARERKKMLSTKTTGAGAADIKKSKWKFYEELIFLQCTTTRVGGADTLNETVSALFIFYFYVISCRHVNILPNIYENTTAIALSYIVLLRQASSFAHEIFTKLIPYDCSSTC